jgi:hypothetical protein
MENEVRTHFLPKCLVEIASNPTVAFVKGEPFAKARHIEEQILIKVSAFNKKANYIL